MTMTSPSDFLDYLLENSPDPPSVRPGDWP
jgi:hypothetical protein